ncbi:MAG TPA: hypothetical protein VMX75_14795 [Spirochaetia bacterium]|nr:hypothetical protein [Spirochaetia bacterium]
MKKRRVCCSTLRPDLCVEDYAKMIMLQIELFYTQGKFREAGFPTVFAAAVIAIEKEGEKR